MKLKNTPIITVLYNIFEISKNEFLEKSTEGFDIKIRFKFNLAKSQMVQEAPLDTTRQKHN